MDDEVCTLYFNRKRDRKIERKSGLQERKKDRYKNRKKQWPTREKERQTEKRV